MDDDFRIAEWDHIHPRWPDVLKFFDGFQDGLPQVIRGYDQRDSRILVASTQTEIVGVLRLIVIPIGPNVHLPAVNIKGRELLEAKVMNFFVLPGFRHRGIGVRLQEAAISLARSLDCYQLGSFSDSHNAENHMLKLSMGFAVRPESRGQAHGLYFIMPLQSDALSRNPPDGSRA